MTRGAISYPWPLFIKNYRQRTLKKSQKLLSGKSGSPGLPKLQLHRIHDHKAWVLFFTPKTENGANEKRLSDSKAGSNETFV